MAEGNAGNAAPRPTINGNNSNVDAMLAKLNQRLSDLADNLGVAQKDEQGADPASNKPRTDVLSVTLGHVNGLSVAHGTMDDIEATLGSQKS